MTAATSSSQEIVPYFDELLNELERGDEDACKAFGRHVHWGYWPEPAAADGSADDYGTAAERLCRRLCDLAGIADGMRVLDVGCGFGGTIASLNERFTGLDLVGVNIDDRQLERARTLVRPRRGNRIQFLQGDACDLQVPKQSFDVVLAVECIFHFPNRPDFLHGAARALVPGGRLALSDFCAPPKWLPAVQRLSGDEAIRLTYGHLRVNTTLPDYVQLASTCGLQLTDTDDITENTLPTYPYVRAFVRRRGTAAQGQTYERATSRLQLAAHTGALRYVLVRFQRPGC